jgi:hypothetical protein
MLNKLDQLFEYRSRCMDNGKPRGNNYMQIGNNFGRCFQQFIECNSMDWDTITRTHFSMCASGIKAFNDLIRLLDSVVQKDNLMTC